MKNTKNTEIAIIGAGAIGSVIGGLLFDKGYNVTLIGRKRHVEEINKNGLLIDGVRGEFKINIKAKERLDFKPDIIFLTMKTQDLKLSCEQIKHYIKDIPVLTFQNGVRADEIVAGYSKEENIVGCIVMFNGNYINPGNVTFGRDGFILIGSSFKGITDDIMKIKELLNNAIKTEIISDIQGARWSKLLVNLFTNSMTALSGLSLKDCINNSSLRKIGIMILKEAYDVIQCSSVNPVPIPGFKMSNLRILLSLPLFLSSQLLKSAMNAAIKSHTYPSTLQSIMRNKTTEIDYLNGEITKLANELHLSAPVNEKVIELVKTIEMNNTFYEPDVLYKIFS